MDAPPGHDAGPSSASAARGPSLEPATPLASEQSAGGTPADAERMSSHHRILAMNKDWKEKRRRLLMERTNGSFLEDGGSSSDTDSDSPPAVELPPAAAATMPRLRPSGTPKPFSPPDPLVVAKRPVSALDSPCISQTPVPLPDFPRPQASAKPSHVASPSVAVGSAVTSPTTTSSSSASSSSSGSTSADAHRAEAAKAQALRLAKESVLEHLHQTQADNATSTPAAATSEMRFPTPGELLAKVRQSAAEAESDAPSSTPLGSSGELRRSSDGDEHHLASGDDESLLVQDDQDILLATVDGRPYTLFQRADGGNEPGRGALFPTNYKLHPVAPHYICPVRDCRRLMRNMASLGGHFGAKHCNTKFNDNLDGTLSLVAKYKNPKGMSPAIVVSRDPLAPDAPPAIEPSLPIVTAAQQKRRLELSLLLEASSPEPAASTPARVPTPLVASDVPTPSPASPDGFSSDACRYLHGFLSCKQDIPSREDVRYMIRLPKRRNLPQSWIKRHRGEKLSVALYAASLAYLVGDEFRGAEACKQRYQQAGRLSLPCVGLPRFMPEPSRRAFYKHKTCIGCCYRSLTMRQRNICHWVLAQAASDGVALEKVKPGLGDAGGTKREAGEDEIEEEGDEPTNDSAQTTLAMTQSREPRPKRRAVDGDVGHAPKAIKLSVGSGEPPETMLEMEPWEMAPGRVTEGSGDENIAFSGALLTGTQPVPTLPDIGVHVILVKPGSSNRWGAEANKVRVCTVAAGKVRVKIGETAFLIGLNGAFSIKPGQSCLVENRFYHGATIHCFSVKDYELVPEP